MDRLDELVTPATFSEKLQQKLGKLWNGIDKKNDKIDTWESVFENVREMLISATSEPDFPIDFNFGETPFSHYAKQMTNLDSDGKLKKMIVRAGIGQVVPMNSIIFVKYRAFLQNEEYPFTSSNMHSSLPRKYQLGSGLCCIGFEEAMSSMKVGERAHFLLAPEIAFGAIGCPPIVPPDAEILLEVELCDLVTNEFNYMNTKPNENVFDKILESVGKLHNLANDYKNSGNFTCAIIYYRKAENLLIDIKCLTGDEEKLRKEILLRMIENQIIIHIVGNKVTGKPKEAISAALRAFQHVPAEAASSAKLKYNLCKAYLLLNEEEKAFQMVKEARKLQPRNLLINKLFNQLQKQLNDKLENEMKCWNRARKKNMVPEHDTRQQYMAFLRESIRNDLENYIENPTSNFGMPWNYTTDERVTLARQADKMNLVYEEYKSHPANVFISIHKRGSALLVTERDEIIHQAKELVSSDEDEEENEGFKGWDMAMEIDTNNQPIEIVDDDDYVNPFPGTTVGKLSTYSSVRISTPPPLPPSASSPRCRMVKSNNDLPINGTMEYTEMSINDFPSTSSMNNHNLVQFQNISYTTTTTTSSTSSSSASPSPSSPSTNSSTVQLSSTVEHAVITLQDDSPNSIHSDEDPLLIINDNSPSFSINNQQQNEEPPLVILGDDSPTSFIDESSIEYPIFSREHSKSRGNNNNNKQPSINNNTSNLINENHPLINVNLPTILIDDITSTEEQHDMETLRDDSPIHFIHDIPTLSSTIDEHHEERQHHQVMNLHDEDDDDGNGSPTISIPDSPTFDSNIYNDDNNELITTINNNKNHNNKDPLLISKNRPFGNSIYKPVKKKFLLINKYNRIKPVQTKTYMENNVCVIVDSDDEDIG